MDFKKADFLRAIKSNAGKSRSTNRIAAACKIVALALVVFALVISVAFWVSSGFMFLFVIFFFVVLVVALLVYAIGEVIDLLQDDYDANVEVLETLKVMNMDPDELQLTEPVFVPEFDGFDAMGDGGVEGEDDEALRRALEAGEADGELPALPAGEEAPADDEPAVPEEDERYFGSRYVVPEPELVLIPESEPELESEPDGESEPEFETEPEEEPAEDAGSEEEPVEDTEDAEPVEEEEAKPDDTDEEFFEAADIHPKHSASR